MVEVKIRMSMGDENLARKQQTMDSINRITLEDLTPKFDEACPFQLRGLVSDEQFASVVGLCNAVVREAGTPLAQEKLSLLQNTAKHPCKSCCRACMMCPCCCCLWPCCNPYKPMMEIAKVQMRFQSDVEMALAVVLTGLNVEWEPRGIRWIFRPEMEQAAPGQPRGRANYLVAQIAAAQLLSGGFLAAPHAQPTCIGVPVAAAMA